MQLGISTACFFPMLTEEALEAVTALGCKTAEVFLHSPSEASEPFARQLRRIADHAGARIVSVHPYSSEYEGVSFFGRYERRFDDAAEEYKRFFALCQIVGANLVGFHGARSFLPIEPAVYFERFWRLSGIAREFGVRLCHENVVPDFVRALLHELPEADLLLDIKQAVRAGQDPFDMLDAMGANIRHLHLSDHDAAHDCLPPGEGCFDFVRLFDRLRELGVEGSA
ncbi:MAG: sugar phosphate isomerase/epimerase, partial [Oscillospiraceae bacterium]